VAHRHGRAALPADRAGGRALSRRRTPERLPGLVDSHCHLQHPRYDADREAVIDRAVAAGIERILVPGWDVASSEAALALADRHPGLVHAAVGVHPHDAAAMDEAAWAGLERLVDDPRNRAVGEIGLDYFRDLSPRDVQRDAFERQLALAAARDLPILIHDRDAHRAVAAALAAWPGRRRARARGVLHAFSGSAAMATELTAAGFVLSFALPVAFRSSVGPREAAAAIATGTFVVETDGPYLGPDPTTNNEPTTALRVVAELERLRGTAAAELVAEVRATYDALVDR